MLFLKFPDASLSEIEGVVKLVMLSFNLDVGNEQDESRGYIRNVET